jgi:hypothetical protein
MVLLIGKMLGQICAVEKATRTLTPAALAKGRAGLRYVLRKQMEANVPKAVALRSDVRGSLASTLRVGAQAAERVKETVEKQRVKDVRIRSTLIGAGLGGFLLFGAFLYQNRMRGKQ